ncbi:hypothetical protein AVEN_118940-1, partial [Araneus ventricosus]
FIMHYIFKPYIPVLFCRLLEVEFFGELLDQLKRPLKINIQPANILAKTVSAFPTRIAPGQTDRACSREFQQGGNERPSERGCFSEWDGTESRSKLQGKVCMEPNWQLPVFG